MPITFETLTQTLQGLETNAAFIVQTLQDRITILSQTKPSSSQQASYDNLVASINSKIIRVQKELDEDREFILDMIAKIDAELDALGADPKALGAAQHPPKLRIWVLRHANRADDHEETPEVKAMVEKVWDTPLAPVGHTTVQKVVELYMSAQGPFDTIVSSTMLRCVQTASIVRELTGTTAPVRLDTGLIEVWNKNVLKYPIEEAHLMTLKELNAVIPSAVIDYPSTISKPTVSETRGIGGSADGRFRDAFIRLANESVKKGDRNLLLCSHGDCIGSVVSLIYKGRKNIFSVEYCGLLVIDYDLESKSFTLVTTYGVGIMDEITDK